MKRGGVIFLPFLQNKKTLPDTRIPPILYFLIPYKINGGGEEDGNIWKAIGRIETADCNRRGTNILQLAGMEKDSSGSFDPGPS